MGLDAEQRNRAGWGVILKGASILLDVISNCLSREIDDTDARPRLKKRPACDCCCCHDFLLGSLVPSPRIELGFRLYQSRALPLSYKGEESAATLGMARHYVLDCAF